MIGWSLPIAVGGIALTLAAVHWLGQPAACVTSDDEARDLARAMIPGFQPATVVRGRDGDAALITDDAGHWVVLKPQGSQFAARALTPPVAVTRADDRSLMIDSGERMFGRVRLTLTHAGDAERVAAMLARA